VSQPRNSALVGYDRGNFVAPNTAAARPVTGRVGSPIVTAAPAPGPMLANRGIGMADAILARHTTTRAIDIEDPEPYDPSLENQLPDEDEPDDEMESRQNGDEDEDETRQNGDEDDDMPRDEDGQFLPRQEDPEDEEDRDVTVIAIDEDVEEEIPDEMP
jgi:hypothetical protein